jgi:hypothetical protein
MMTATGATLSRNGIGRPTMNSRHPLEGVE